MREGKIQSHGPCGSTRAHLSKVAWSGVVGHVAAHGRTPCLLSYLEACMRGYPIYRVLTTALRF
jgi:hypothetical protein